MILALPRFGIKRDGQNFQLVYPDGMLAQVDQETLVKLLSFHRQIKPKSGSDLKYAKKFLENDLIDEFPSNKVNEIEDHFDVQQIISNIETKDLQFLTLSDLAIFFTKECNYRCLGCSVEATLKRAELFPLEKACSIIGEARALGCITLALTGGEPVMPGHIDYMEKIIKYSRKIGFKKVIVATNGFFLPEYIDHLKEAGVTRFSISFLGLNGFMESYTGNPQSFARALDAIHAVIDHDLHLGVNCVIMKKNHSQIPDIVEYILGIIGGIPHAYLRLSPLIKVGRAKEIDENLDIPDLDKLIGHYLELKEIYHEQLRLTCYEDIEADTPLICDAGVSYICVNAQGNVYPCDLLQDEFSLGNVFSKSLIEIWNDQNLDVFRSIKDINSRCANCSLRQACFGKCRALSYMKHHSLDMQVEPDYCYGKENYHDQGFRQAH